MHEAINLAQATTGLSNKAFAYLGGGAAIGFGAGGGAVGIGILWSKGLEGIGRQPDPLQRHGDNQRIGGKPMHLRPR